MAESKDTSAHAPHIPAVAVIILSLVFGFVGGWLAFENNQTDTILVGSGQQVIDSEGQLIAEIAERVGPSVVSLNVTSEELASDFFFGDRIFRSQSAGSGIIISDDGLVVTNKHVIPEGVSEIEIVLADGTTYDDIEIIGRDPFNDIAFLRINTTDDLQPAVLGDSTQVRVGERVVAIGNALGQFETTVTSGIISGVSRPLTAAGGGEVDQLQDLFQTDAAINPGNSGGPLLNINGEVIGINTAVAGAGAQNIGFAIPIRQVTPSITSIQERGELVRPYLGVRYVTLTEQTAEQFETDVENGALIVSGGGQQAVLPNSPAAKAGLQEGDIITAVEDTPITLDDPLVTTVSQFQVGETITLSVNRDGEELDIEVTLEEVPESFN